MNLDPLDILDLSFPRPVEMHSLLGTFAVNFVLRFGWEIVQSTIIRTESIYARIFR